MKRPNYKAGQFLRTPFAGTRRSQVFCLVEPLSNLGGPRGGHWRVRYLEAGTLSEVQVESCTRVPPREVATLGLVAPEAPKKMDPDRFVIGERVRYVNHVTGDEIGKLEVAAVDADFVTAKRLFGAAKPFKFHRDGRATWSSNLSIQHA